MISLCHNPLIEHVFLYQLPKEKKNTLLKTGFLSIIQMQEAKRFTAYTHIFNFILEENHKRKTLPSMNSYNNFHNNNTHIQQNVFKTVPE